MIQVARGLTDAFDGFLLGKRHLILDRDSKYTNEFRKLLHGSGTNVVQLPARSPDLNAYAERFVLSIKSECLDRMIFFTETSLRNAVSSFVEHYHRERCHQGLDHQLIDPKCSSEGTRGQISVSGETRRNAPLLPPPSCLAQRPAAEVPPPFRLARTSCETGSIPVVTRRPARDLDPDSPRRSAATRMSTLEMLAVPVSGQDATPITRPRQSKN